MLENGKKLSITNLIIYSNVMDKELTYIPTEIDMLETGEKAYGMGMGLSLILTGELMKESGKKIS